MKKKQISIDRKWLRPYRVIAVSVFFATALFAGLKGNVVSGQKSPPILKNPTELQSVPNPLRGGDVNYTMDVRYGKNTIPNPSTGRDDTVNLRSYNGELVGPTVRILPGQLLRMNLINNLPGNDPSCQANQDMSIPHCFNSTNLHTHGWHVSPTGNSDNVLLDLGPGTNLDYEYYLPKDHPAGTFWYHSHRHGSTALQVSSGMAGALIVEGIRPLKDIAQNGIADIDTILKYTDGKRYEDRVFMFEQIEYDCGTDPTTGNLIWNCQPGQVGQIEGYQGFGPSGPNSWQGSGRFTMINGLVQPLIETQAGKIERWRLIHGGVRDTINFRVVRSKVPFSNRAEMMAKLAELQKESPAQQATWMAQNCSVDATNGIKQTEFAVDGLTRAQMSPKMMNVLQPGYRSDVLMAFDKPGVYCVLDDATTPAGSINAPLKATPQLEGVDLNDRRLLSMVFVSGGTPFTGEPQEYISKQLILANQDLPQLVKKDLTELKVPEYVPHRDILPKEVTGKQELAFAIRTASDDSTTLFQVANLINPGPREYFSYDPDRIDRLLRLGGVDEWQLTSRFVSHPFHIHVNPFQIVSILKPDGKPIIDKNGKCVDGVDPQYCDMIGVWRDTFFIKQNPANFQSSAINPDSMGYLITMRTRYERYIGDFVLHCHILDHEDSGMMQNVRIAPIGGYLEGNPTPTEMKTKHSH
jgi:L-ascorbate oxidase